MLDFLFAFIDGIRPMSSEVKQSIEKYLHIVDLPKNELLLRDGQRCDHINVVLKGMLRMYYIKKDEEVSSRFAEERQMCLSVNSFFNRVPGYEYIQSIEPSVIARIHHDDLERLYADHLEFNYVARVITQQYFIRSEERLFLLRRHSAEERYQYLMEHHPTVLQRVPLKYIASYIGINLETLSRIRKKLSSGS